MNIAGAYVLAASPDRIWWALHDVEVLRETLPDCESLEQTAPDTFTGVARVGIAVIKGTYDGYVRLSEEREPVSLHVSVEARSGHAQIKGEGSLSLEPADGGTRLAYAGDARVFGPLAAVGQRLIPSAAKSMTERFFKNLERKLTQSAVP